MHQQRSSEARDVVDRALTFHPNSLRLQEYKDRIDSGHLGGEERELVVARNLVEMDTDYINDSSKNHSWRSLQRLDFGIRPGLTNRLLFEQQFQHGFDDSFEAVETFNEELRWRVRESLLFSAGGGAVRFNNADVHAIYDTSLAFQPMRHLVLGAAFSRVPIIPDAEASEHRLTAQGWEAFSIWTPARWQINLHGSRQHYSDGNIGSRQSAEVSPGVGSAAADFRSGLPLSALQFRHRNLPTATSVQTVIRAIWRWLVFGFVLGGGIEESSSVRSGLESPAAGSDFRAAWEIHARNEVPAGKLDVGYRLLKISFGARDRCVSRRRRAIRIYISLLAQGGLWCATC